ncbi:MAG: prepilin peptidase [Thermoleophilaceae bacterium]|nr:prepilin peptidase [Thermoleophilaceae bacterium]
MPALIAALLGAIIGSFLNVVIARVPARESLVSPGSKCPGCGTAIKPYDNMPVISWVLLRGRCRSCGEPISARYPLVEALTALVFAGIALVNGFDEDLALELPFAAVLIAIAFIDLDHRVIPNRILLPTAVYGLLVGALVDLGAMPEMLIAGAAAFTFLLVAALAYPAGMGMGDVKLAGVMGLFLGAAVAPALLIGFAAGAGLGIAMIAREGAAARKKGVPFGPFLALGGIVALLVGNELIDLYSDRFL